MITLACASMSGSPMVPIPLTESPGSGASVIRCRPLPASPGRWTRCSRSPRSQSCSTCKRLNIEFPAENGSMHFQYYYILCDIADVDEAHPALAPSLPPSLPPSHHGGTRSSLVWRQILQPDIKVIGAADGQSTTTLALIIRRSASLGHQRASDQISVLLDLGAATAATAASFCLSRQGNS